MEKVEQAARELGYHLPGRKNRKESRKEKLIVVFCPTLTSPYYVLLLAGELKQWRTSRDMVSLSVIHREIPSGGEVSAHDGYNRAAWHYLLL